jgi:nucleoside-diphosphate-sugar epimerase
MLAIARAARGPFNLAAADSFSFRDELRWRHKVIVPLPPRLARSVLAAAWRLTGWGGEPAWIDGLARTLTLDCARARSELGWRPRWTGGETLALT